MCLYWCGCKSRYPSELIQNPTVWGDFEIDELYTGHLIKVTGTSFEKHKFSFVLYGRHTKKVDIALFFCPDLEIGYVVLNARINKTWGDELFVSRCTKSIKSEQPFQLEILIAEIEWILFLNGFFLCTFPILMPLETVNSFAFFGEFVLDEITTQYVRQYPIIPKVIPDVPFGDTVATELPNPYGGKMKRELQEGQMVEVYGKVNENPRQFIVKFQNGFYVWPNYHIELQMTVNFGGVGPPRSMILNARVLKDWGQEQRTNRNPLKAKKEFHMVIKAEHDHFSIWFDRKLECLFRYRGLAPMYNTFYIGGDISIYKVFISQRNLP